MFQLYDETHGTLALNGQWVKLGHKKGLPPACHVSDFTPQLKYR
jgi:hypothetical protein